MKMTAPNLHTSFFKIFRTTFLIFGFFLLNSFSYSQNPVFKTLNLSKIKNDFEVNCFLQNRHGYLWVGTNKGLIEYNGVSSRLHTVNDSLGESAVTALLEDSAGTLWIGHPSGKVSLRQNGKFVNFEPPEGTPTQKIMDILQDKKGRIWFATYGEGIYYYDGIRMYNFSADDGLSDNSVYTIFIDKNGIVWAGTDGGITIINADEPDKSRRLKKLSMKDGLPDNIVKSLVQDADGNFWIGMSDVGVCKYVVSENKFVTNFFPGGWKQGTVSSLFLDKFSELWIGTEGNGLLKFSTKTFSFRKYNTNQGLANNKVISLFSDRESNFWIGTAGGITQYAGSRFEFLAQKEELPSINVTAFCIDSKENHWIGTDEGLIKWTVSASGENSFKKFTTKNGLSHNHIVSIFEDRNGNIWLGTYGGGVCKLNPSNNSILIFKEKNGLANDNVMSIAADKDGNLWFATLGGGVSKLNFNGGFENFSGKDGLGSDYVYFVFCDSKNNLWFATDGGGVSKFDGNTFQSLSNSDTSQGKTDLKNATVFSIAEDGNGNIWFTTSGSGIYKFDSANDGAGGKKFQNFFSQNGLRDDAPPLLIFDGKENMVIAHKTGIDKLNLKENRFQYFGEEEGLKNFEPNTNAVFRDKNGVLWIGTSNGVVKYKPSGELNNLVEPLTQIIRYRVLTKDIEFGRNNNLEFSHNENNVTFDFIGVSLTNPSKVRYKYKLENFENDWSEETDLNSKNYPYLPHGKYKFMVIACNNEGVWNKEPMVQEFFVIRPPYWLTWWFWTLVISFLGGGSYIYTRWRLKQIEAEKRILENKVKERTAEVVKQKEIIEEKNKDITDSINYAKRIQEAILPSEQLIYRHLSNSFVLYKPKDIVSGDFYWFSNVKQDGKNFFLIAAADCTGHGVPGAFMSMIGNTTLNQLVNEKKLTDPSAVLTQMSEAIKLALKQDENESQSRDGMDVALCAIDLEKNELRFAGAYRPLYLVHDNQLEEIKGNKFPVGGLHILKERIFTSHNFTMKKGDTVYICSDGYADQFGGPEKRKFMTKRFKELLMSIQDKTMQEQKTILEKTVEEWKGNMEQMDDILVIGIRF